MKAIKETIHAQGIEIGIYTTDFENEFISFIAFILNFLLFLLPRGFAQT